MAFGPRTVRAVTHLDVSRADCEQAAEALAAAVGVSDEPIYFASPAEFRAWLEEHHETETEVWVGMYKKATGKQGMSWSEAVDEALCFGWIDGIAKRVDDERHGSASRRASRRATGASSTSRRSRKLRAEGRMRPAGEAAFARRRDGPHRHLHATSSATHPEFTPEQRAAFEAHPEAWAWFQAKAPTYRRHGDLVGDQREAAGDARAAAGDADRGLGGRADDRSRSRRRRSGHA